VYLRPVIGGWFDRETLAGLVVMGMALLVTRLLFDFATQVYHALLDLRLVSAVTVLWQVAFLGGLVVFFQAGYGVLGVLLAAAAANVVAFLILALGWRGRLAPAGERETPDFRLGRILRYGLPFAAIQVFYTIVWRHSETILITRYWGPTEAGYFGTAYAFTQQVLDFVPTAIWPLVMASYAAVFTLDRERARRLVAHYYKLLFLVATPLSVGGAVLGDRALIVLYGAEYAPGGMLAQIFFVVQCLSFLGTPLSMTLYVLERTWVNLLIWVGAAIVNVGLNVALIPIDWRLGAALPVSLAVGLMPIAYWLILSRQGYRVRVPWSFLGRVVLGSVGLLALIPLRGWVSGAWQLLVAAILSLILVGVGMRLVRVFRRDDERLLEFIPSSAVRRGVAWFGEVRQ
jgi:O-antigen/teichoic acid export membrane protein